MRGGRWSKVLPAETINTVADLVAAGYEISVALEVLPRSSLKPTLVRHLEREIAELKAGGPLDVALEKLGLEITPTMLRGSQSKPVDVEAALRADAAAQIAADQAMRKTRAGVTVFALIAASVAAFTFTLAFVLVPNTIEGIASRAQGAELPAPLVHFEHFRNTWLVLGAGFALVLASILTIYAGIFGRTGLKPFLHDFRLMLPFVRQHAIRSSSARLLDALAHEGAAGIPANETLRRARVKESVPILQRELALAEARMDAGDSWKACLQGTMFSTPMVADLASLASRGARPTEGWRWAAAQNRQLSVKSLRRAVIAASAIVFIPSFLYMMVLLNAAVITTSVAEIEGLKQEINSISEEVERIFQAPPP